LIAVLSGGFCFLFFTSHYLFFFVPLAPPLLSHNTLLLPFLPTFSPLLPSLNPLPFRYVLVL
jgi:hypothetical protein